ncbi:MAG TPA: hypothetical protein VFR03_05575 [Thermoanaerobaculia bacterium]|nr:hypothetical protein [Thermoanaerobaculia bacterium]
MKKPFAWSLVLSALSLAPLQAATVYVPVLEPVNAAGAPRATQLWISNYDHAARPYSTTLLPDQEGAEAKSASATVPADRAIYLARAAAQGETGLLAIDDESETLLVNAWVKSGRGQNVHYAGLPVISSETQIAAGAEAYLNGVGREGSRDITQLALINLGDAASQCQVDVVAEDGSLVRAAGSVEVPAKSVSRFEDALGLRGEPAATARVSCDQPFYALAALADSKTAEVSFVNPSETVETAMKARARKPAVSVSGSLITFDQNGLFHAATPKNAKKVIRVPVPRELGATRVLAEFDVVAGPWNPRYPKGAHNLIFLHRGKFRGNTLANINAFGPGNNKAKAAQNVDLPAHYSTSVQFGFTFEQGQTYHISSLYDAATQKVTFGISQKGKLLKSGQYDATSRNPLLTVPAAGLVAEFGNYNNQFLPEVSSLGWKYSNFHVEIVRANN